jgi:hypothetical protein
MCSVNEPAGLVLAAALAGASERPYNTSFLMKEARVTTQRASGRDPRTGAVCCPGVGG